MKLWVIIKSGAASSQQYVDLGVDYGDFCVLLVCNF
jgi:hypothetical protein